LCIDRADNQGKYLVKELILFFKSFKSVKCTLCTENCRVIFFLSGRHKFCMLQERSAFLHVSCAVSRVINALSRCRRAIVTMVRDCSRYNFVVMRKSTRVPLSPKRRLDHRGIRGRLTGARRRLYRRRRPRTRHKSSSCFSA